VLGAAAGVVLPCRGLATVLRPFDADGTTGPGAGTSPDATVLTAVARVAEIPGVSPDLARAIIASTGRDMTRFPTAAGRLVSWAGLCPSARQSGARIRAGKKGQGRLKRCSATPSRPPDPYHP
jgi:transposase IS116/IS110/IS902 family protein